MGIDIYARWKGQSNAETQAQCTGFSVVDGHLGYLREAYHGGPYVTKYLVAEAFATGEAAIPAAVLRERLPCAVLMALYRYHKLYSDDDPAHIEITQLHAAIADVFANEVGNDDHEAFAAALSPASLETGKRLIDLKQLPPVAQSFADFVELCERQERATGEPCIITSSY